MKLETLTVVVPKRAGDKLKSLRGQSVASPSAHKAWMRLLTETLNL